MLQAVPRRHTAALVVAALGLAASPLLAAEPPVATPLVLIGGGPDDTGLAAEALSLAGGTSAKVGIVSAASSRPQESGPAYQQFFGAFGVSARYVPLPTRESASAPEAVRPLSSSELLFFSGGDQSRLAERIAATPVLGAIQDAWVRGAVVAGTSAGAMPWGSVFIANGSSLGAFSVAFDRDAQGNPGLELKSGLRLTDNLIVDTHFDARQRLGRLLLAVAAHPANSGIGVDEVTAAIVTGDDVRALGRGAVTIVEARNLTGNNAARANGRTPFAAGPFRVHRLKAGQNVAMRQGAVRPGPTPTPTPSPGFFFGLFGSQAASPLPNEASGPQQPITLIGPAAPPPTLWSPASFVRDAGGTQAKLLILTGNGASRDAETWRGHLLLLGAGRARVLTASEIHDQNLARVLEASTGVFLLEDAAGTLDEALTANRRQLRDVLATYAPRLPMAAAGLGVRILGPVAYLGNPGEAARLIKPALDLLPSAAVEDLTWEPGGVERLVQAALLANRGLGIGLGAENSVRIEHGQVVVIGKGQALFVEARNVSGFSVPPVGTVEPAQAIGLEVSVIPPDGVYDFTSRRPRF
jgi:cyanophycinase